MSFLCIRALLLRALMLLVSLPLMAPSAASADYRAGAVAVPLAGGLERETATIAYAIDSVVRQSHRVEHVDLAIRAEGREVFQERQESARRARSLYDQGVEAYQNFEFATALHALEDAIAAFEDSDLTEFFPDLLEAYAMQAATAYFNGDVDGARTTIRRLLSLRSNYVFDGRLFPPDIREVAESIRSEVEQESRNPLEVMVDQTNARVYVNGVFRGISPIEIRNLPPTRHHLSLVSLGFEMLQEEHRAAPGALVRLAMTPAADGAAVSGLLSNLERALSQGKVSEPSASIARWAGVDEVFAAGVARAGGGALRVMMARVASDGHVLAKGEHELSIEDPAGLSELAAFVSQLFSDDFPRGPGNEPVVRELRSTMVIDRTTIGYLTGGGGVAAGIGGAIMGFRARQAQAAAKAIPQRRQEEIQETMGRAKSSALIADVLYGAAFVGVVAGVYLAMPALQPEGPQEVPERGLREDWFSMVPVPLGDGAMLTVGGRF